MNATWQRFAIWIGAVVAISLVVKMFDLDELSMPRRPLPEGEGAWIKSDPGTIPEGKTIEEAAFEFRVASEHVMGDDVNGTAFAVSPEVWVTAAHVVDDCRAAYVRVHGRWRRMQGFATHENADVAILKSAAGNAPPVLGITDRLPVLDQDGFHVGYPQGKPSTVRSKFLGMARLSRSKVRHAPEMGWVWAEIERSPDSTGSLGGISGGPQADRTGAVQGVTVAHAPRTGRIITTPVSRVREVVPEAVPRIVSGGANITADNYAREGEHARTAGSIALVFCSASGETRP